LLELHSLWELKNVCTNRRKRVYVVKNVSTMKAAALKDFSPYVAKVKAQSAGDVNRVFSA
jgi:hypothetical protein